MNPLDSDKTNVICLIRHTGHSFGKRSQLDEMVKLTSNSSKTSARQKVTFTRTYTHTEKTSSASYFVSSAPCDHWDQGPFAALPCMNRDGLHGEKLLCSPRSNCYCPASPQSASVAHSCFPGSTCAAVPACPMLKAGGLLQVLQICYCTVSLKQKQLGGSSSPHVLFLLQFLNVLIKVLSLRSAILLVTRWLPPQHYATKLLGEKWSKTTYYVMWLEPESNSYVQRPFDLT